jgi:hypothetical protein
MLDIFFDNRVGLKLIKIHFPGQKSVILINLEEIFFTLGLEKKSMFHSKNSPET